MSSEQRIGKAGKRWENQMGNQVVEPLLYCSPTTLDDRPDSLVSILAEAARTGAKVKPVGAGHSYSDIATTIDFLVGTHGLEQVSTDASPIDHALSHDALRRDVPALAGAPVSWDTYEPESNRALVECECGIRLSDLCVQLDDWNLALPNMGGYDGQTIMGVISTSTHGSGITLGPFPDLVRSLVLATTGRWDGPTVGGGEPDDGVYLYRIEPSDGPTDPARYDDVRVPLIQDDACFDAVICSMGTMGVVYSLVIEVMQTFWLQERRSLTTLDEVLAALQPDTSHPSHLPAVLADWRHYEVLIHPYAMRGGKVADLDDRPKRDFDHLYRCLETRRRIVPRPSTTSGRKGNRDFLATMLGKSRLVAKTVAEFVNLFPKEIPKSINMSLETLVDDEYIAKSHDVYVLGLDGDIGIAAELAFPLDDTDGKYTIDHLVAAIDTIHEVADFARRTGDQYQTSAFSVRFVAASRASLSMMEGGRTVMIELDMLNGTRGELEVMNRLENATYALGGRPHWGLDFDNLVGSGDLVDRMYPRADEWRTVYRRFNERGTFDNSFTRRMGFDRPAFERTGPPGR